MIHESVYPRALFVEGWQYAVARAPVPEVPVPTADPSVDVAEHVRERPDVTANCTTVFAVVCAKPRRGSATKTVSTYSDAVAARPTLRTRERREGERRECPIGQKEKRIFV